MRIEHIAEINCPVERLWTMLEEPAWQKRWMKRLSESVWTSEPPCRTGSTFRLAIGAGRGQVRLDGVVLVHHLHHHLGLRLHADGPRPGAARQVDYFLDRHGGRTRLHYACEFHADHTPLHILLLAPLYRWLGKREACANLARLKALAEREKWGQSD